MLVRPHVTFYPKWKHYSLFPGSFTLKWQSSESDCFYLLTKKSLRYYNCQKSLTLKFIERFEDIHVIYCSQAWSWFSRWNLLKVIATDISPLLLWPRTQTVIIEKLQFIEKLQLCNNLSFIFKLVGWSKIRLSQDNCNIILLTKKLLKCPLHSSLDISCLLNPLKHVKETYQFSHTLFSLCLSFPFRRQIAHNGLCKHTATNYRGTNWRHPLSVLLRWLRKPNPTNIRSNRAKPTFYVYRWFRISHPKRLHKSLIFPGLAVSGWKSNRLSLVGKHENQSIRLKEQRFSTCTYKIVNV